MHPHMCILEHLEQTTTTTTTTTTMQIGCMVCLCLRDLFCFVLVLFDLFVFSQQNGGFFCFQRFPGMPFPNPGDVVELQAWQGEIWEARSLGEYPSSLFSKCSPICSR